MDIVHREEVFSSASPNSPYFISVMTSLSDYLQLLTKPIPRGALKYRPADSQVSVGKLSTCKTSVALVTAGMFGSGWSC